MVNSGPLPLSHQYDVIVIGAGHNGLVCATYLAKAGLRVLILEEHDMVGGACITEPLFPGCKVSSAACWFGMLRPQIIADLNLYEYGLAPYPMDPQVLALYPDGRHLFMWLDDKKTIEAVSKFAPEYALNDISGLASFNVYADKVLEIISPLFLRPPISQQEISQLFAERNLSHMYEEVFTYSVSDLLDLYFKNEALKAAIAFSASAISNTGPYTPRTAFDLFYMMTAETVGNRKVWGFVRGGMGAVTAALEQAAISNGVQILTNSKVEHILVNSGKAVGVALRDGSEIHASIIVSNADPKRTFLELLPSNQLDIGFTKQVRQIRMAGSSSTVHLLLDGLPQFKGFNGDGEGDQHRGMIVIAPSMEYINEAWRDAAEGRISDHPILTMSMQSVTDESIAPVGKHVLSVFVQFTPYNLAQGNWSANKSTMIQKVLDTIEEYAPNIRDILLESVVFTPVDLENKIGLTGGHAEHGDMIMQQLFENRPLPRWAQYQTPIRGLYLCSAGTHPGGTVTGAPGFNAAHTILDNYEA
jgi:phytoene dehydrogenase-like protein